MRRPAPTVQLSPQVIRQFALITLIVTALLAMFADGENSELAAAIKAREAQTQLEKTQASKLGAAKFKAAMKPEVPQESGEGFEKLNDRDSMNSGGSGPAQWAGGPSQQGQGRPVFMRDDPQPYVGSPPPNALKGVTVRRRKPVIFTDSDAATLKQRSRERSGVATPPQGD